MIIGDKIQHEGKKYLVRHIKGYYPEKGWYLIDLEIPNSGGKLLTDVVLKEEDEDNA